MKKNLLFLIAVTAMSMSLNARVVLINEGFENGIQDSVWTQEFVAGDTPWAVEDVADGLSHPSTVVQGTKRAYLRNNTGETLGYMTRLVSKVMDLRPTKVYMPELSFSYANLKWGADRDTLRVLYRAGERGAWKVMAEYSSPSSDWQRVKMSLPEVNKVYQIAFEGKDNLGRGIVLDSITLQSAPECTVPDEIMVTNRGAGKVNIMWSMSYDAFYYELIVTKDTIDPDMIGQIEAETPEKVVFHGEVYGESSYDLELESGEFYLVYIRSMCGEEMSAWSSEQSKEGPYGFRVRSTKQIPFTETFNYPSGVYRDADWSWGGNTGKTNPFVNSSLVGRVRANYSPDTTAAVVFSGGAYDELTTPVQADRYAYFATPALTDTLNPGFQVNQCQVHFWSTVYTNTGRQYGRSIIVGVMDDPDDISTFTPVDTISVWGDKTFVESIVDLGSYDGTGAYIAFVSQFDRANSFYIDNLTVEYKKEENKVTNVTVNPRDTYATISWEGNASSYNILVTNAEVNPSAPAAEAVIRQATVTTNTYRCDGLEADHSWNRPYYVYVQAQGQEWSYRYPFVTIASKREIPYHYDFEASTTSKYLIPSTGAKQYAAGIGIFGNSGSYPSVEIGATKSYVGSGYLYLSQMGGKDSWITLPMVEDLSSVQVKFYLSGSTTYDQAHASIGVMSNPMDISTYVPVADFQLNAAGYTRCYANFENYNGPAGVIAIVWEDVLNMSKYTNNYIDEIVVEELSECVPPTDIDLQIEPDSITLRWEESDLSDEWEVFISRIAIREADRMNKSMAEIAAMGGVDIAQLLTWNNPSAQPEFGISGLNPHTKYYLYVRATCDPDWWTEVAFSTPCRDEEYPYKETFESYNLGGTSAGCWQLTDYMGVGYPKVVQVGTVASGSKSLNLYSSGTTHRSMAILPLIDGDLSDMLFSFDVRTSEGTATSSGVIYVGTMEDIRIESSFVPFDTVYVSGSDFKKVRFVLSNYNLAHDHLAITSGIGTLRMSSDVLIDNVELKDPSCIEAYDFVQTNFAPHNVDLSWSGTSDNDEWELKVLSSNVSINAVMNGAYNQTVVIVDDTIVTGKNFSIGGLQAQHNYYIYVRTLCGDSVWAMAPVKTSCELLDPTKPNKETFESYPTGTGSVPNCWTVGTRTGTGTEPYINSIGSDANATRVFYIGQSSTTSPSWVASPELQCDTMTSLVVSFLLSTYSGEWGVFGVMTDPTDLSTFVPIDSLSGTGSTNQMRLSYDLSEYAHIIPATAKYFAWRGRYGTNDYVYIDDVSFISNACPMTKPSISELTTSSVRVSSGLRTDDQWILLVANRPLKEEDLAREDYVVPQAYVVSCDTLDRRSKTVNGLEGQTTYYVYTATMCDATTKSQWNSLSFTTPCRAIKIDEMGTITFSEKEGFTTGTSGEMPCWTKGSKTKTASSSYIPYVNNSSSYQHNGNNYLYMYDYVSGTTTHNVGAYAIMPALEVDSISKYQVNFWGRSNSSSSYNNQVIVGVITDPSDLNTFVPVDTLNLSRTAWDPYSVGFEKYEGDYMGNLGTNIMFLTDFGMTNYAYISEISIELIPHCRPVSSFTVDSVGEAAAIISWKGYQDTYRLLVSDKELSEELKPKYHYLLDTIVDHSQNVLLTNLHSTTNYYVYAQGICDGGDSTAISITYAAFRTECPTETGSPLPFYEDFESYTASATSFGCWQAMDYSGSGYPKILNLTSGAVSGLQLELWSTSTTHRNAVMMPLIDGDLADCQLSFDTRSWSGGSTASVLYIGTMADINDATTFVPFDTVYNESGAVFNHVTLTLADYELVHDYLAFSSGLDATLEMASDVMIDNIVLERVATCSAPKLKLIGTSFSGAEITLTPVQKTDSLWEVVVISETEYNLIGDIAQYLETATKMTLDSTHLVLSGLQDASSYYVYARTICSDEDRSSWSRNPLKFSTQFYYADSYFFGFEKKGELWQRSMYSVSDNYYLHPAMTADHDTLGEESQAYLYYPHSLENADGLTYARTGTGALRMQAEDNYYGGYIIFPALGEAQARSFEFKARPGAIDAETRLPAASEAAVLEIGMVEKDKSFDTYEKLATIRLDKLNPRTTGTSKNNYLFSNYTLDLDSATIATKQLVFHMPKQQADTVSLFIDDVSMSASKGFSMVALNKVVASGTSALVEWANVGGPWKLTIKNASGQILQQFTDLNTTSLIVEDLEPRTSYTVLLEPATVPSTAKSYVTSDKISFSTRCEVLEPTSDKGDFVWNFDNESDWEANDVLAGTESDSLYLKPSCFQVGITYDKPVNGYQWLIQRKGYEVAGPMNKYNSSAHGEVGRNDSPALRICTASNIANSFFNSYIVLPELDCSLDTMMIEFYGRCFVNFDESYPTASARGKITGTLWLGSEFSQSLVVGTLTDPLDFSTLQIIDTVTYTHTDLTGNTNVNDDPAGLRYWELMRMPLDRAQGKYIVLFQPAPGLFFLDDLAVKPIGNTLFAPTSLRTSDITATSAVLSWNSYQPDLQTVVVLQDGAGNEISRATVTGTSYTFTSLQPAMNYQWYAYQTNGTELSPIAKPVSFVTACTVITPDYTCGFEPEEGWKHIEGQKSYTQTLCWTYSDAAQNEWKSANNDPYNQANTETMKYSYSGNNALVMRASSGSRVSYQPYVALPAMDITSYDTLQVMFRMRPAYVSAANDSVLASYTGATYSKSVIVGTMTDPDDASTFVAIDTVTYDGTLSTADKAMPENDFLFQLMKVELAGATGPYVALMTSFREKGGRAQKTGDYVWIDDISFAHRQECKDPTELETLMIGSTHAVLHWNGVDSAENYILQVSTDPYFIKESEFVFNGEVKSDTYRVEGLAPQTAYVWRVQSLCGERWGESSFSQKATFKTSRSPYFYEGFDAIINANEWMPSKSRAASVLDSAGAITRGVDNWSFVRTTKNYGLEGSHYVAPGYSNDFHWLITPNLYLPENDSVHFSMDLALTACNTAHTATSNTVTENDMKDDYFFMIIVSEDGGATWMSENILAKWQNTNPEGMQLRDIPSTGMRVRYSLAKYAGKNVRVGLYREAKTASTTGIAIHVDNVRFGYFDKTVDYASACQYEDVTIGTIHLSGDDTQPGLHAYPTAFYASDAEARAGVRDSVFQLEIEVFAAQETLLSDTICEGETYTGYDFLPKDKTGVYRRKLHTVEYGCDSIVTLNLHVKERRYAEPVVATLCAGETFIWNDKIYNRAGLFSDTVVSSIGCDSVMTIVINNAADQAETYYDTSRVEISELPFTYYNAMYPYAADQQPISYPAGTPKGTYVDTVRVEGGQCANKLIHTLIIYDKHEAIDAILDGKSGARKVIIRDRMYILLNNEWYTPSGQKISDPRR